MQAMLDEVAPKLKTGVRMLSETVCAYAREGDIGTELGEIAKASPEVIIGSYPFCRRQIRPEYQCRDPLARSGTAGRGESRGRGHAGRGESERNTPMTQSPTRRDLLMAAALAAGGLGLAEYRAGAAGIAADARLQGWRRRSDRSADGRAFLQAELAAARRPARARARAAGRSMLTGFVLTRALQTGTARAGRSVACR